MSKVLILLNFDCSVHQIIFITFHHSDILTKQINYLQNNLTTISFYPISNNDYKI